MTSLGFRIAMYGNVAARTARLVDAHRGKPDPPALDLRYCLVASLTAKKTAPAGILDTSGVVMPRKLPLRSFNGS